MHFKIKACLFLFCLQLPFGGLAVSNYTESFCHEMPQEQETEKEFRENTKACYLYCPGFLANTTQAGKYSRKFYYKQTGEEVISKNGMQVLGGLVYTAQGSEVTNKSLLHTPSCNPLRWPSYAWHALCYKLAGQANTTYGISIKNKEGDKKDSTVSAQVINPFNITIGLEGDKQSVIDTFKSMCKDYQNKPIVLYAVSRGTSALMHALPDLSTLEDFKRVKAIVLEGAFDSMEHLYAARFSWLSKAVSFAVAKKVVKWATGADQGQNRPIDKLKKVLKDCPNLPVLLISSKIDRSVPYECTHNLYNSVKDYKNVEFVTLHNSSHPSYMFDDREDRECYQQSAHAFYAKHGLPYIKN